MISRSPGRGHAGERGAGYRRGLRFAGRCQGSALLSDAAPYCAQAWSITPYFCQTLPEGMLPFLYVFELSPFFTYSSSVSESESEWLYSIVDTLRKGQAN